MAHVEVTDEWLYRYIPLVDMAIIEELESKTDTAYEFSDRFKRKMKKLVWKEAHPWFGTIYGYVKRASVFCIGIIGVLFLFVMSVEAYRVKFFETVSTIWEDSVEYSYTSDISLGKIQQYREPGYIPEGYREVDRVAGDTMLLVIYENDAGEQIIWSQVLVTESNVVVMDSEYDNSEIAEINGFQVTLFIYDNGLVCSYFEYGECVYTVLADNLDIEKVYAIIESFADARQ